MSTKALSHGAPGSHGLSHSLSSVVHFRCTGVLVHWSSGALGSPSKRAGHLRAHLHFSRPVGVAHSTNYVASIADTAEDKPRPCPQVAHILVRETDNKPNRRKHRPVVVVVVAGVAEEENQSWVRREREWWVGASGQQSLENTASPVRTHLSRILKKGAFQGKGQQAQSPQKEAARRWCV